VLREIATRVRPKKLYPTRDCCLDGLKFTVILILTIEYPSQANNGG